MNLPSVSVCFPAYNEEKSISSVLHEAHELLSGSGLDYEIIVCNDGSQDRTGEMIRDAAREIPRLRVIDHVSNQGIRATFEDLYSEASKEFVFLNSTDRQWKTEILFDLLEMTEDWDIIIASRREKNYSLMREAVSSLFNMIPRLLFGVRTYDAGAVKLMRREIIERFSVVSRSPFNEAERLIRAARAGYRITEFPVETFARNTGRARGVSASLVWEASKDVVRVWWSLHRKQGESLSKTLPKSEVESRDRQKAN